MLWQAWRTQLEGWWNDRRAVGRVITAENDEKQLKLMVDECAAEGGGVSSRRGRSRLGENQKSMVEECAAKVVDELQKKMVIETGKIQLWRTRLKVQCKGGGQLMASLGMWDQDSGIGDGIQDYYGHRKEAHKSPRARQVWLKMDGKG